jgi:hypothetical protein
MVGSAPLPAPAAAADGVNVTGTLCSFCAAVGVALCAMAWPAHMIARIDVVSKSCQRFTVSLPRSPTGREATRSRSTKSCAFPLQFERLGDWNQASNDNECKSVSKDF